MGNRSVIETRGPDVRVHRIEPVVARVRVPGSKSHTNRYLAACAIADGDSELIGASQSDDTRRMSAGLAALGIGVQEDADRLRVAGCRGHIPETSADIDAGASGTAMRFLTALCALGHGTYRLDGSARMRERPIGALVDALLQLGARTGYEARPGYPPLTMIARGLSGGTVSLRSDESSQFLSALLLVAPYSLRDVLIEPAGALPSRPYVDMTVAVLRSLGAEVIDDGGRLIVPGTQRYRGGRCEIEPDASAACYFWAIAAITGGTVAVEGLSRASVQGDVRFIDVLASTGCRAQEVDGALAVSGPSRGSLRGISVDLNEMPDTVQTLAVVALFADGPTEIRNVANLRIKETDRLAALGRELTKLGARVELRDDGLAIHPPQRIQAARIETYDDHRMAMSFALAGLGAGGVEIAGAGCVSKSFPEYFRVLASLQG